MKPNNKKTDLKIVESPTVKFLSKVREIKERRKANAARLKEIISEREKAIAIREELLSQHDKLCVSKSELERHRQDAAKGKTKELIARDDITPAGVAQGVIQIKATEQKLHHIRDNIHKLRGGLEGTDIQIRKLNSEYRRLEDRQAHLINLERLLNFIDNFYRWAEVYKASEGLFTEAQSAAIEMKAEGFKVAPALKELGIEDELVQMVLGCSWILTSNAPEALQQVSRANITSKPDLNPFFDFSGKKRIVRGNNLTSDFRTTEHIGQGFSFTGADINAAREATFRQINQ